MIVAAARIASVALVLVPASAGTPTARPPVALTASPAHVTLAGSARATVRVTNSGANRVVVDVTRAGFALDLRGRPRIVRRRGDPRSAARWLFLRPRRLTLPPGKSASLVIASKLPSRTEPGDHDALVLLMTRPRANAGVAVRMRMGIVVVVRAPGAVERRLELHRLRVVRRGRLRALELLVANHGNVTESIGREGTIVTLDRQSRRVARLVAGAREFRPRTRGIVQFRYRGRVHGWVMAHVILSPESGGRVVQRTFRVRL